MSKTKYLFLSLLLLSTSVNAQAAASSRKMNSTTVIILLIVGILIIRLFYKSKSDGFSQINPMTAEKLGEKIGKFLASLKGWKLILYPMIIFSAYVFFKDTPNKKSNSSVKEEYLTPASSSKQEKGKCDGCSGKGYVSTYSSFTCTVSHFEVGGCGGHKSGFNCTPVGTKTCRCCNGSGIS